MRRSAILAVICLSAAALIATACATTANETATTSANRAASQTNQAASQTNQSAANVSPTSAATTSGGAHSAGNSSSDDAPAMVKAAFPGAQSFTTQHKDVNSAQTAAIEKDAGARVPETDHHSYLAFTNTGGARRQIGAATVVKADGKEVVIVYESRGGMPTIKEVRAETVPAQFLAQFAGKGHDDKFQIGADLKASGADEAVAKAVAAAVRVDAKTMQTLYGAAHSH